MNGHVIGLVALDFVLRVVGAGAVVVALPVEILRVDGGDAAADVAGLGIPADVVADLEGSGHGARLLWGEVRTVHCGQRRQPHDAQGYGAAWR